MSDPIEFNTLFKYDSTGKARFWDTEVDPANGAYRTVHGIIDGEASASDWVYCKPKNIGKKNATTAEEQEIGRAHV